MENLAYALVQVAHNFGAVAVVGGALLGRWPLEALPPVRRKLAWLVLFGWVLQGGSGAGFGTISYIYYGRFPDLHHIALAALLLKTVCALGGVVLAAIYLYSQGKRLDYRFERLWNGLIALGVTALSAAAFLRWFA